MGMSVTPTPTSTDTQTKSVQVRIGGTDNLIAAHVRENPWKKKAKCNSLLSLSSLFMENHVLPLMDNHVEYSSFFEIFVAGKS